MYNDYWRIPFLSSFRELIVKTQETHLKVTLIFLPKHSICNTYTENVDNSVHCKNNSRIFCHSAVQFKLLSYVKPSHPTRLTVASHFANGHFITGRGGWLGIHPAIQVYYLLSSIELRVMSVSPL